MAASSEISTCKWLLRRINSLEEAIEVTRELLVGRCKESPFSSRSLYVSRKHCKFKAEGNFLTVTDIGSGNGTFVNKKKIPPGVEIALVAGDVVGLGVSEETDEDSLLFQVSCNVCTKCPVIGTFLTDDKCKNPEHVSLVTKDKLAEGNDLKLEKIVIADTDDRMSGSKSSLSRNSQDSLMVSSVAQPATSESVSDVVSVEVRSSSIEHCQNERKNYDKKERLKADREYTAQQCVELLCTDKSEELIKEKNSDKQKVKVDCDKKRNNGSDAIEGNIKKFKLSELAGCSENLNNASYEIAVTVNNSLNEGAKDEFSITMESVKTVLESESHGVSDEQVHESQLSYTLDDDVIVCSDNEGESNERAVVDITVVDDDDVHIKSELLECGEEWEESDDEDKSWFLRLSQSQLEEAAKGCKYDEHVMKGKDSSCPINSEIGIESKSDSIEPTLKSTECEATSAAKTNSTDHIILSEGNLKKGETTVIHELNVKKCSETSLESTYCEDAVSRVYEKSFTDPAMSCIVSAEPSPPKPSSHLLPSPEVRNVDNAIETVQSPQPSSSSFATVMDSEKLTGGVKKKLESMKHARTTLMCEALPMTTNLLSRRRTDKNKSSAKSKHGRLIYDEDHGLPKQKAAQKNREEGSKEEKHCRKKIRVKVLKKDTSLERLGSADKKSNQSIEETRTSKDLEESQIPPKIFKLQKIPLVKKKKVRFAADDLLVQYRFIPVESGNNLQRVQAKDAPLLRRCSTYSGGILDATLKIICQWNISWLAEQRSQPLPPPCYGSGVVYPMLTSFAHFQDYKRVLMPLMFLNLWASISEDVERFGRSGRQSRGQIQNLVFDSVELGTDMMKLHCHILLTENAVKNEDYPFVGDLCQLDIRVSGAQLKGPLTQSESQDHVCWARLFAYVESNSRDLYFERRPHIVTEQPLKKINLVLRIRIITFSKVLQLRLKVLSNIRCDLRAFEAVEMLKDNGLCERILKPSVDNFKLPPVDLSSDQAWKEDLNAAQKKAVLAGATVCLGSEPGMCLIQGPPGTGKSLVIISMIMEILNRYGGKHNESIQKPRILLCAPSNAAVDELVERLLKIRQSLPRTKRFKMVRTGHIASMRDSVRGVSLCELAKNTIQRSRMQNNEALESTVLEIENLKARKNSYCLIIENARLRNKKTDLFEKRLAEIDQKLDYLQSINKNPGYLSREVLLDTERRLLAGADIIATTLGSCYNAKMMEVFSSGNGNPLTCCVLDEASQCLEPQSLIPLMFGLDKMVLVGDSEQLPGTVRSRVAQQKSYGQSLFTRLCNKFFAEEMKPYVLLNIQYRMHEEICRWPNAFIYNNQLSTALNIDRACPLKPYVVLAQDFMQTGEINEGEAHFVSQISRIVKKLLPRSSVSVITPYQKQKQTIKKYMETSSCQENVSVNTIDGFQGQECDIVILSCTRTQGIGFLSDSNRLNVALTRARKSLIICGNFISLQVDQMWKSLLEDASCRGVYFHVLKQHMSSDMNIYRLILK